MKVNSLIILWLDGLLMILKGAEVILYREQTVNRVLFGVTFDSKKL
jgi:hypothetical protein